MKIAANLESADIAFATANTPLYLMRKLRTGGAAASIAASATSSEIFQELRAALDAEAADFRSSVLPYVLLEALFQKSDKKFLDRTEHLDAPHHPWFKYCSNYLIGSFQSHSIKVLAPNRKVRTRPTKRGNRVNSVVIGS